MSVETVDEQLGEAERCRALVKKRLEALMQSNSQLYYEPTSVVARAVYDDIQSDQAIKESDHVAMTDLSVRDIEIILAFK